MGEIKIYEVTHEVFGKCMAMDNGLAEIWVTTEIGPRIIRYSLAGKENMLYQDTSKSPLGDLLPVYGGDVFRLYGGHRLWISPEVMPRCYHPDNQPVECAKIQNGMKFTAAVEKHAQIQKSMTITMAQNSADVEIIHEIKNCGLWEIELAPWAITMMAPGGVAVTPTCAPDTGYLPNRRLILWDYTDLTDDRLKIGKNCAIIRQSPEKQSSLKIGLYNNSGYGTYFNHNQLFIKQFEVTNGNYPDFGCNYEVYTNDGFLETETLGVLVTLAHEESVLHKEKWQLFNENTMPQEEATAMEIIRKYVK